jgi:hypothetical protein
MNKSFRRPGVSAYRASGLVQHNGLYVRLSRQQIAHAQKLNPC